MFAVILTTLLLAASSLLAQGPIVQYGRKAAPDKGPRALGLVKLSPTGQKGRLIPIAIMMDGKFFDAGSYKASPVPMALDFDTVYEAFRSGVSQGLFTITQPGQLNHAWVAEGTWLPAGMKPPEKSKKYSAPIINEEDKDAPPVLHRHAEKSDSDKSADKTEDKSNDKSDKDKGQDKAQDKAKDDKTKDDKDKATAKAADKDEPKATTPSSEGAKTATAPEAPKVSAAADEPMSDPNRPRLRRGKPDATPRQEPFTTFDDSDAAASATPPGKTDSKLAKGSATPTAATVLIPAISDAGGPEARPYTYDVKPEEEESYRKKMIELADKQLQPAGEIKKTAPSRKQVSAKTPKKSGQVALDNVRLHIFDLSSSNEPVLVLSAITHPADKVVEGSMEEPKEVTLIARTNLEGELQKLFFSETDSKHLDVSPRMELLDAVDADGDGRGELLFRRTFDGGSAYAIYRVTADGLWPLFEGTP